MAASFLILRRQFACRHYFYTKKKQIINRQHIMMIFMVE
jgi:hypothetical protein